MSDYNNPITYVWNPSEYIFLNLNLRQTVITQLMKTQVLNDNGLFAENSEVASSVTTDYTRTITAHRNPSKTECTYYANQEDMEKNCPFYLKVQTNSGGKVVRFTRTYKGVVETFGDIGGIRDIIFSVAMFVYGCFHSKLITTSVVRDIFKLDRNPENQTTKKGCMGYKSTVRFAGGGVSDTNQKVQIPNKADETASKVARDDPQQQNCGKNHAEEPVQVEIDHSEAFEMIEEELDVVNIIRKLLKLEALFRAITDQRSEDGRRYEEVLMLGRYAEYSQKSNDPDQPDNARGQASEQQESLREPRSVVLGQIAQDLKSIGLSKFKQQRSKDSQNVSLPSLDPLISSVAAILQRGKPLTERKLSSRQIHTIQLVDVGEGNNVSAKPQTELEDSHWKLSPEPPL